jgi:hypothetical protein
MGDKKNKIAVLLDGLAGHPAFLAWKRICPASASPASIEVLKGEKRKCSVYRLRGVTGAGGPVIVKRNRIGELSGEARIYTDVFPAISLPVVDCYGYLEEFNGDSWLFLEDAGEFRYSPENPAHCALAIRWMACLHSTPTKVVSNLWDSGPAYFRSVLREARKGVRSSLAHPSIGDSFIGPFEALLDHLEVIENGWTHVEQACSGVPQTLVHGDFVPKNVRVRGSGDDTRLLAVDWETAGAAPPAADIAMIPGDRMGRRAYFEMLKVAWRNLAWEDVERLHRIGRIFRLLHAVQWESRSFKHAWIERAQRKMLHYQRALHDLVQDGLWLHG